MPTFGAVGVRHWEVSMCRCWTRGLRSPLVLPSLSLWHPHHLAAQPHGEADVNAISVKNKKTFLWDSFSKSHLIWENWVTDRWGGWETTRQEIMQGEAHIFSCQSLSYLSKAQSNFKKGCLGINTDRDSENPNGHEICLLFRGGDGMKNGLNNGFVPLLVYCFTDW